MDSHPILVHGRTGWAWYLLIGNRAAPLHLAANRNASVDPAAPVSCGKSDNGNAIVPRYQTTTLYAMVYRPVIFEISKL